MKKETYDLIDAIEDYHFAGGEFPEDLYCVEQQIWDLLNDYTIEDCSEDTNFIEDLKKWNIYKPLKKLIKKAYKKNNDLN